MVTSCVVAAAELLAISADNGARDRASAGDRQLGYNSSKRPTTETSGPLSGVAVCCLQSAGASRRARVAKRSLARTLPAALQCTTRAARAAELSYSRTVIQRHSRTASRLHRALECHGPSEIAPRAPVMIGFELRKIMARPIILARSEQLHRRAPRAAAPRSAPRANYIDVRALERRVVAAAIESPLLPYARCCCCCCCCAGNCRLQGARAVWAATGPRQLECALFCRLAFPVLHKTPNPRAHNTKPIREQISVSVSASERASL